MFLSNDLLLKFSLWIQSHLIPPPKRVVLRIESFRLWFEFEVLWGPYWETNFAERCRTEYIVKLKFMLQHFEDWMYRNSARVRDVELLTGLTFFTKFPSDVSAKLRVTLPTIELDWKWFCWHVYNFNHYIYIVPVTHSMYYLRWILNVLNVSWCNTFLESQDSLPLVILVSKLLSI